MISITREQIVALAPHAKQQYLDAFAAADNVLANYEANANALRVAHFVAQVLHETGALTILTESLNYSTPERLMAVWPSRFPTKEAALPFVRNSQALAEKVYGGRMGNVDPGDGFKYIGRGMIQITGRESYERFGRALGIDLAGAPDLAVDSRYSLAIAAEEWRASGCNGFADNDDLRAVTKAINGGYIGLDERRAWLVKTKATWPST
jgi:putative chitinase